MSRLCYLGAFAFGLASCAGPQLREVAVDMGPSFGSLQERQVVANMASLIVKPWTIPGQIDVTTGSLQVQNQAMLDLKFPFHGIAQEGDPSAQSQEQDSFTFTPVTDGDDLRRVRALYRYAICHDEKEFVADWEETIKPYEQALINTTEIAALPVDQEKIDRYNRQIKETQTRLGKAQKRLDDVKKRQTKPENDGERRKEFAADSFNPELSSALQEVDSLKQTLDSLAVKKQAAATPKKAAAGGANSDSNDNSSPADSVQLERAKERMVISSLGKAPFVRWTMSNAATASVSPCRNISPADAAPLRDHPYYQLGSYSGVDLWTDQPEKFSKFMLLVIGSTPNTSGVHALTLGLPGNAPSKSQAATPTLLKFVH